MSQEDNYEALYTTYTIGEIASVLAPVRDKFVQERNALIEKRAEVVKKAQPVYDAWPHRAKNGYPVSHPCLGDPDFHRNLIVYPLNRTQKFLLGLNSQTGHVSEKTLYAIAYGKPKSFLGKLTRRLRAAIARQLMDKRNEIADTSECRSAIQDLNAQEKTAWRAFTTLHYPEDTERMKQLDEITASYDKVFEAASLLADAGISKVRGYPSGPLDHIMKDLREGGDSCTFPSFVNGMTEELNVEVQKSHIDWLQNMREQDKKIANGVTILRGIVSGEIPSRYNRIQKELIRNVLLSPKPE